MFTLEIENGLELALVEPSFAKKYLSIVKEEREYLSEWLVWPSLANDEDFFLNFIEESLHDYASGKSMTCAIILNSEVVGNISFNSIQHALKKVEIGYWLSSRCQGKGIVNKSVCKLIEIAFIELGMDKVQISVAEKNKSSRQVCERLGFKLEGIIKQAENLNGLIVDHAIFGLQRSGWFKT